jgi:methyl-accepting chemotaxis protein
MNKNGQRNIAEIVFGLSIAVMNRLRYSLKFGLMGILLVVPIGILSYINTSTLTDQVDFNWKEHLGVDYADPLKDFLKGIQKHRVLRVAILSGDVSFRAKEVDARTVADDAAKKITELDSKRAARVSTTYGELLQTSVKWPMLVAEWEDIKTNQKFASPAAADAAYEKLTAEVIDLLLNSVANYSNLILDPDLDSYWLMDAYVGKLPVIAQTVSKAGSLAILPADANSSRQLDLAGYYKIATGTSGDLSAVNMATTFKETVNVNNPSRGDKKDLESNLKPKLEKALEAVNGHADDVIKVAFAGGDVLNTSQTRAAVNNTLETLTHVYSLYDGITPELDYLIQRRVSERYEKPRLQGIVTTFGAVALIVFLFAGFFLSVQSSIVSIGQATRKMISGTDERFVASSRDELGEVLDQYNEINGVLNEARKLRDQVAADNSSLQANLMDLLEVVSTASEGDMTVRARVTEGAMGNLADAFNQLLESLQRLVGEINAQQASSTKVIDSIRQTVQAMADGASAQARELRGANQLVDAMSSEIQKVSMNARTATEAANRTQGSAIDGSKNVDEVVHGMDQLRQNVQSGAKKMKLLGDRSMEITTIVSVINRISEQTNMLALNAAIEAARAGEHGRGFNVVAEEVRKLAERTAQATQEIDKLVKTIQSETNETVAAMETQTEVVERESGVVAQAGTSLARIREVSTQSAALVAEISSVAERQVESAKVVVGTMGQISNIAVQTESGAQRASSAMVALVTASEQLAKSIRRFKLT